MKCDPNYTKILIWRSQNLWFLFIVRKISKISDLRLHCTYCPIRLSFIFHRIVEILAEGDAKVAFCHLLLPPIKIGAFLGTQWGMVEADPPPSSAASSHTHHHRSRGINNVYWEVEVSYQTHCWRFQSGKIWEPVEEVYNYSHPSLSPSSHIWTEKYNFANEHINGNL